MRPNHIRELVDPDANIIWGSAFNDDLNGKIRVSVVATGIDNEAQAKAAPASQPFSFANRPTVVTPVPSTPQPVVEPVTLAPPTVAPAEEAEAETAPVQVAPEPPAPPAPFAPPRPASVISDFDDQEDELVLGAESADPSQAEPDRPVAPAPRVAAAGGTLFERMSGLSRGIGKSADDDAEDKGGLDIPRFLNRQNNQ